MSASWIRVMTALVIEWNDFVVLCTIDVNVFPISGCVAARWLKYCISGSDVTVPSFCLIGGSRYRCVSAKVLRNVVMASAVALGSAPAYRNDVVVNSLWYTSGEYAPGINPVLAASGCIAAI